MVLAIVLHGLTYNREHYTRAAEEAFASGTHLGPGSKLQQVEEFAESDFVAANFVPPSSPFFPAATTTTTKVGEEEEGHPSATEKRDLLRMSVVMIACNFLNLSHGA